MKHKAHGLKYEIGVRRDGLICWIYGPIPGSVHDITIVRQGGLQNELLPGEFVLGDKGYMGEAWILTPFKGAQLTDGQRGWNHTSVRKLKSPSAGSRSFTRFLHVGDIRMQKML